MNEITETEKRIERRIARAKVRHMSNAKWRKLFAVLHQLPVPCTVIGLKLINRCILSVPAPGPDFDHDDNFGECGGISHVPFAHIEFVGISNADMDNDTLIAHLNQFGQWPIQEHDEGILILGYEWD